MKYVLPLLILINTHEIIGVLEWTVTGKVTDYGQNVTLFCHVPNCCPEDAGWDRWTPAQHTLFIDVKSGRSNKKYDGKVMKDGYTLVIQNLTRNDLNVSYSCLYGVTFGERKFLLEEDVFSHISTAQPNAKTYHIVGIVVAVVVLVAVALAVSLLVFYICKKRNRQDTTEHGIYKVVSHTDTDTTEHDINNDELDEDTDTTEHDINNDKLDGFVAYRTSAGSNVQIEISEDSQSVLMFFLYMHLSKYIMMRP